MTDVPRVIATEPAARLIAQLRAEYGPLLFHQSGGCCDGSSPMCFAQGDFLIGNQDVLLGEIAGAPFYISGPQFALWRHTQLIIDVVPGRGGMFSLENGREVRFHTRSRLFTDAESAALAGAAAPDAGWTVERPRGGLDHRSGRPGV
ncbi:DUF779 domain-containing protein [uncultured Thiodictyon sp.]|uniref:DUF779 domain-containing protein n=1 Tax=uncultured Thiodictyon sp. TaxID=1846217 RepID=UPI0025FDEE42|nr:DUF779 domain-containing protein [uncultured Thiodictyon sp.]